MAKNESSAKDSKGGDGKLSKKPEAVESAKSEDLTEKPEEPKVEPEADTESAKSEAAPPAATGDPLAPLTVLANSLEKMFIERKGTNLPGITETEVKKMASDVGVEAVFQFSNGENTRGRLILKYDGNMRELPADVNQEYDFGIDFDAMGEKARAAGREWNEAEEKKARAKYEADNYDKNRKSVEKLKTIGTSLEESFKARSQTNLPGLTEKDVMDFLKPHQNSIGIEFERDTNAEAGKPRAAIVLSEFGNKLRVPEKGFFPFGVQF